MKKLTILGAGRSGVGTAILAKQKGWKVFVSDSGPVSDQVREQFTLHEIEFEANGHSKEKVLDTDEIMKSPGIPDKAEVVREALKLGIPVFSEIEFASRYTGARIVGITGTNGKTTTTALTYSILKNAGLNVGMAGNIGKSFAYEVATENHDIYVLELSSFQLDGIVDFKPDVGVLLNITPDHLDRYGYKLENYAASKFRIARNQGPEDAFIYCLDDPITNTYINQHTISASLYPMTQKQVVEEGAYLDGDQMLINLKKKRSPCPLKN